MRDPSTDAEPASPTLHPDVERLAAERRAEREAEEARRYGPVKWCKTCSRYHRARAPHPGMSVQERGRTRRLFR